MTYEPINPPESPKPRKPSIAAKVSFWSQFVGSIGSLFFKGTEDKQKVIDIAKGISDTAIVIDHGVDHAVEQTQGGWQDGENL